MFAANQLKLAMGLTLLGACTIAQAAPFTSFDPRSMGMGGAGVAVGNAGTAPLFNPALLAATHEGDRFALQLPIVGARVYDPDDFVDAVDNFQDSTVIDDLDTAISNFEASADLTALKTNSGSVATAINNLNAELINLGGKPLQAELGAAVVLGIPSRNWGFALSASASAAIGGVINYDDSQTLQDLADDMNAIANCTGGDISSCIGTGLNYVTVDGSGNPTVNFDASGNNSTLQSSVDVRGIVIQEIGLSLAREFTLGGHSFALGITPKSVTATVLDYTARVEDADDADFDADDYTKEYTHFNMDIGLAKDYANGWRTGVVVRNIISQEYDTYRFGQKTGNTIKTEPQVRLGISHQGELYTLAADLDVTENDPVGYEGDSRYLAMGAELNAWGWAQLRAGYRANLSDSERNVWSVGMGLSPFGAHLDLAVSGNDNEMGAALQLGFRF